MSLLPRLMIICISHSPLCATRIRERGQGAGTSGIEVRMAHMRPLVGNQITIFVEGQEILTLQDILPATLGIRVLFVGKTPAPCSVEAGHYFQGKQGATFWSILKKRGLLAPTTEFEDDSLLGHGYGLTDIVKVPHAFGVEPSDQEYMDGSSRILKLIRIHRPKVLVFVYKKVLDKIIRLQFTIERKSIYGFNQSLETHFGARVFAFPLPGVGGYSAAEATSVIQELVIACKREGAT
jgi:TDG/mug DNA glycosylase family protein